MSKFGVTTIIHKYLQFYAQCYQGSKNIHCFHTKVDINFIYNIYINKYTLESLLLHESSKKYQLLSIISRYVLKLMQHVCFQTQELKWQHMKLKL